MLLFITEDEHGYVYEPHGTEPEVWSTTLEGSDLIKAAGWKPHVCHRVSRHLHEALLKEGQVVGSAVSYVTDRNGQLIRVKLSDQHTS
jgi:hypothetical protein